MRNIHNALSDTLEALNINDAHTSILRDPNDPACWRVSLYALDHENRDVVLEVEVIDRENGPVGTVLFRRNMGRHSMTLFMNTLMDKVCDD
jgi:hypothetical protein